jgi:hypothetical protein
LAQVDLARDGGGDEGGAILPQKLNQPFLLRHKRINPGRLSVKEVRDNALLVASRGRFKLPQQECGTGFRLASRVGHSLMATMQNKRFH